MAGGEGTVLLGDASDEISERAAGDEYSYLPWVDCICAGVPCQDVSIAGKRVGIKGERTGLVYEFARILRELRPTWFVFENVPGLLSSNDGRDFAEVLRVLMVECGYGISWRVLDSQFFGVAQRRSRLFIVGYFGKPCPVEILFEPESLPRSASQSGEARKDIAVPLTSGIGLYGKPSGRRMEDDFNLVLVGSAGERARALTSTAYKRHDDDTDTLVAGTLTTRHTPNGHGAAGIRAEDAPNLVVAYCLREDPGGIGQGHNTNFIVGAPPDADGVRDFAGLPKGMDSPRYRALGNAVTVNVARWIAERIIDWETKNSPDSANSMRSAQPSRNSARTFPVNRPKQKHGRKCTAIAL